MDRVILIKKLVIQDKIMMNNRPLINKIIQISVVQVFHIFSTFKLNVLKNIEKSFFPLYIRVKNWGKSSFGFFYI